MASQPSQLRERQSETVVEALQGVMAALEVAGVAKKQKRQMSEIQKGISALSRILSADDGSMTGVFKTSLEGIRQAADASRCVLLSVLVVVCCCDYSFLTIS